jgi:hypothetical protein
MPPSMGIPLDLLALPWILPTSPRGMPHFNLSLGAPDLGTQGRPSNPSGGPVYAPSRFLWWNAPILPCDGRKCCGGSLSCPLGAPFRRGPLRRDFVGGIRNVLSERNRTIRQHIHGGGYRNPQIHPLWDAYKYWSSALPSSLLHSIIVIAPALPTPSCVPVTQHNLERRVS